MANVSDSRFSTQRVFAIIISINQSDHRIFKLTANKNERKVKSEYGKSKKEGKGQESLQSSTTPDPRYQWESDNFTIRHHKREPEVSLLTATV